MHRLAARTILQRLSLKACGTLEFVEGRSVAIVYRWGDGQNERMAPLAAELVALRVAAIVSITGATGALAAKRLTSTIPIVFLTSGDAVQLGLVSNLSKPVANLTGGSGLGDLLVTKQFGLLGEFVPKPASFGLLHESNKPKPQGADREHGGRC